MAPSSVKSRSASYMGIPVSRLSCAMIPLPVIASPNDGAYKCGNYDINYDPFASPRSASYMGIHYNVWIMKKEWDCFDCLKWNIIEHISFHFIYYMFELKLELCCIYNLM